MATVPDNFLGLSPTQSEYRRARFAVLPIPYDATTSFMSGTRCGPRAIITASQQVELYQPELGGEFVAAGVATLEPLQPNVAGPEAMHRDIFRAARGVVRDGKFLLSLGGEHGITSALVKAVRTRHRQVTVVQIDAHADLRNAYEQSHYSHASVMRRIHDLGVGFIGVGIRNFSLEEARFMKRQGITPILARDCRGEADWIQRVLAAVGDTVYLTIDIDGFDPAYAPGTGTPEPGGLDWYQVTALLRALTEQCTVVAADIVEVIPIPGQVVTEFLAAKLAYQLICLVQPPSGSSRIRRASDKRARS